MNDPKLELIAFRLNKADVAYDMANIAASRNYWNTSVSELYYYSCFYLVSALFAKNGLKASTHSGVKTLFGSRYITSGILKRNGVSYIRNGSVCVTKAITVILLFTQVKKYSL